MVPFYLLAGGAAVGLLRALAGRFGRAPAALLALATVGALLTVPQGVFSGLLHVGREHRNPAQERLMRWCLQRAATDDVYLAPDLTGNSYLERFFFEHPRIHRRPTAWPLPGEPSSRPLTLVTAGTPWWSSLQRELGARRQEHALPMPDGLPTVRFISYRLQPEALRGRALQQPALARGFDALILIPRPGRYRLRPPPGVGGTLELGDFRGTTPDGKTEWVVGLAAGLQPATYKPWAAAAPLQWLPPGERRWQDLPARLLWHIDDRTFPLAPRTEELQAQVEILSEQNIPVDPSFEQSRLLQDLAPDGDGGYLVADMDRYPVKRWARGKGLVPGPVLLNRAGQPFALQDSYDEDHQKTYSLAHGAAGSFLLDHRRAQVLHFGPDGRLRARLGRGLRRPEDLALDGERLYVADPGQEALLAWDLRGEELGRVRGVWPVAVAAGAGVLAYVDHRQGRLLAAPLPPGEPLPGPAGGVSVQLARVDRQLRLAVAGDRRLLVCDPNSGQTLLFGPQGQLLAVDHDPLFLAGELFKLDRDVSLAGFWDSARQEVALLSATYFNFVVFSLGPGPPPPPPTPAEAPPAPPAPAGATPR